MDKVQIAKELAKRRALRKNAGLLMRAIENLPKKDGFEFIGVTLNNERIKCRVHKCTDGNYLILGADIDQLEWWHDLC